MDKIKNLYVLGKYKDGKFIEYVRKGRNNSITGYDNLSAAKRGLAQSCSEWSEYVKGKDIKIIFFDEHKVNKLLEGIDEIIHTLHNQNVDDPYILSRLSTDLTNLRNGKSITKTITPLTVHNTH
jgi:ABC-type Zn uptake system ZnuABC Zn-binding protein ZnuA